MLAQALICDAEQRFSLQPVVLPEPGPDRVLIRNLRTGVSIGTEFALIRRKLDWGPYPLCVGYQGVGVIEQAGDEVEGYQPGDLVYYRHNAKEMTLEDGTPVSAVAGVHCSHAVTETGGAHGIAEVPDGCDLDAASLFVMPAVGLAGIDMAQPKMGSTVVVNGCGQIGLGVVALCALRGAVVIAIDIEDAHLDLARKLGADHTLNSRQVDSLEEAVKALAPGMGDTVFECTGIPACLDQAIPLARATGTFVLQGNYGAEPVSFHFLPAHGRRLNWVFPCDDGWAPSRRAVLKLIARGALPWGEVITHRVTAAELPEFYERLNRNDVPGVVGAVVNWE